MLNLRVEGQWVRFQWIFFLILTGAQLAGCVGTNPVTPVRFYVLNPAHYSTGPVADTGALVPPVSDKKISLEILSLGLPQYLEKPQIVTRTSLNQLAMEEYHQWGGNLRKNMIRVIARNMSALLATPHVAMAPFRPQVPPDFSIEVEVMEFEPDALGRVKFSARWRLLRGRDGMALSTQFVDLESPRPDAPGDVDQMVSDMGKIIGEFCMVMGKEILLHVPGNQAP